LINHSILNELAIVGIVAILIILSVSLGVSNVSLGLIESPEADLFLLPFHNQSREAELIILGHVLDKKLIWERSVGTPLDNYTVSVEKVLKGIYKWNTIGVIAESQVSSDSPKFNQNEGVILFLHKKPLLGNIPLQSGNIYSIVNYPQGQYALTDNGIVRGLDIANISLADFEKKIRDESSPKTNFTQLISNEAEFYYYRNDKDIQVNDSTSLP
jgi:hypothetical protein